MEKQEKIDKLKAKLAHMKQLDESQFNYSIYINKNDPDTKCGSVCCVAGWYPVWFKDKGFFYQETIIHDIKHLYPCHVNHKANGTRSILKLYHGVSNHVIAVLFYGHDSLGFGKPNTPIISSHGLYAPLSHVIAVWEEVISFIEQDILS